MLPHQSHDVVTYGFEPRVAADLLEDISTVALSLPQRDASDENNREEPEVLLVFEHDRYLFAVALLACWVRGFRPLVPPNHRRATLARLQAKPGVRFILHDTEAGLSYRLQDLLAKGVGQTSTFEATQAHLQHLWASGQPSISMIGGGHRDADYVLVIGAEELREELERLDKYHPWQAGVKVASCLPLGHRYGFVWSLLRPLVCSGAFLRQPPRQSDRWSIELPRSDVLVSVPYELRRLLAHEAVGPLLSTIEVISSMTSTALIQESLTRSQLRVLDVLSSNQHGALATREVPSEWWRCLSGVEISVSEQTLSLPERHENIRFDSALCPRDGAPQEFRFREEKAEGGGAQEGPSLFELELWSRELCRRDEWLDVAFDMYPTQPPTLLAAALLPPTADFSAAQARFEEQLKRLLLPVELRTIVTSSLPRDALGRLQRAGMRALFGVSKEGKPRAETIDIGAIVSNENVYTTTIRVPLDYRWFDGHFDAYPVLPAAVQLHCMVIPFARLAELIEQESYRFERLKFVQRIMPGAIVKAQLTVSAPGDIRFELRAEEKLLSSGRLISGKNE